MAARTHSVPAFELLPRGGFRDTPCWMSLFGNWLSGHRPNSESGDVSCRTRSSLTLGFYLE